MLLVRKIFQSEPQTGLLFKSFTSCPIFNQIFSNASFFQTNSLHCVRWWIKNLQRVVFWMYYSPTCRLPTHLWKKVDMCHVLRYAIRQALCWNVLSFMLRHRKTLGTVFLKRMAFQINRGKESGVNDSFSIRRGHRANLFKFWRSKLWTLKVQEEFVYVIRKGEVFQWLKIGCEFGCLWESFSTNYLLMIFSHCLKKL